MGEGTQCFWVGKGGEEASLGPGGGRESGGGLCQILTPIPSLKTEYEVIYSASAFLLVQI